MKVRVRGTIPSNWTDDVTCPHCQALLGITVEDISFRTEESRNFWRTKKTKVFQVKCPECTNKFRIKEEHLPEIIIDYLSGGHGDPDLFEKDYDSFFEDLTF